jgi:hypothetical protein
MARAVEPRPLAWAEVDRPFGAQMGTSLGVLDTDVHKAFRSGRAVNHALRLVIEVRKV